MDHRQSSRPTNLQPEAKMPEPILWLFIALLWQQLTDTIILENYISSTIYPEIYIEKILNRIEDM